MVRLLTAEIDRFGPLKSCHPECNDGITIIGGPNESGKTLYLEGLLQLLDPAVSDYFDPDPRVDGSPTGRVVVTNGSERHTLGEGTALSEISPITPDNLHNLFVVRDSDLHLPEGTDYYTRLVERLGDIHTTDINRIREDLVEEGRLTKKNLNLANRELDTKRVRNSTRSLANEIEGYLEDISEEDLREKNRERFRKRRELEAVCEQLENQTVAKRLHDLEYARDQLSTYQETTSAIKELEEFDRDTLAELRELDQNISRDESDLSRLRETLSEKKSEREDIRKNLADTSSDLDELQQREQDVGAVEDALEEYRSQQIEGEGHDAKLSQRRAVTIVGLIGAAVAGGIGAFVGSTAALGLGFLLLVVGLAGWYLHRKTTQRITDIETRERELIEAARDAGFEIETPAEVAPAIRGYRDTLEGARERRSRLEAELDATEDRISEINDEIDDVTARLEENQEELAATLADADVNDISEFEAKVVEREDREDERNGAERDLHREVGEPDADKPDEKIEFWQSTIRENEASIGDVDIEAAAFDESTLQDLQEQESKLAVRVEELDSELDDFQETIEDFERRANELDTTPFVETQPTLQAYTVEGLEALLADLRSVLKAIEYNAEISRKAIKILDSIRDEEQEKITTLFDPDGPASSIFSDLTDGRYEVVDYNPDTETLEVTASTGQRFSPHELSRGTKDQLFLAARLSLAHQILGNASGFLILDDPFLAADPSRLRSGFEILQTLTNDGWQVIYLSAKDEVRNTIADEFDLDVYELPQLDL